MDHNLQLLYGVDFRVLIPPGIAMVSGVVKVSSSSNALRGAEIIAFLKSFEGSAAVLPIETGHWSLWLPELSADEHPVTPASQIFFPVILSHEDGQAIAMRFYYDCSAGNVRYYTSAIPEELARLPQFENAVSELFRHSVPVEPIRQRSLRRVSRGETESHPPAHALSNRSGSLSEPLTESKVIVTPQPAEPVPGEELNSPPPDRAPLLLAPRVEKPIVAVPEPSAPIPETKHTLRLEIGPRFRAVLMAAVITLGVIALAALGVFAYLRATEDPGVTHHRLQIEELRAREGR